MQPAFPLLGLAFMAGGAATLAWMRAAGIWAGEIVGGPTGWAIFGGESVLSVVCAILALAWAKGDEQDNQECAERKDPQARGPGGEKWE